MVFTRLDSVEEALEKLKVHVDSIELGTEKVHIKDCIGRVLAENIRSDWDIPAFNRSVFDGYAVNSRDLKDASCSNPVKLALKGIIEIGDSRSHVISAGETLYIPTGGMLPHGADTVVMKELIKVAPDKNILFDKSSDIFTGVMKKGEDINSGATALISGKLLKPHDLGTFCALGVEYISVYKKPKVSIFSTGNEIVPPFDKHPLGKIRDINGYVLAAMVEKVGGEVLFHKILGDDYDTLKSEAIKAKDTSDIVIFSGGSSVGTKDLTAKVIDEVTSGGILTHGLNIRPGKPTVTAYSDSKLIFGLPGHPGSSTVVFMVVVKNIILQLLKQTDDYDYPVKAVLSVTIKNSDPRRAYQMVDLTRENGELKATPVLGKSGAIVLFSKSKGYIIIPENTGMVDEGTLVDVFLV